MGRPRAASRASYPGLTIPPAVDKFIRHFVRERPGCWKCHRDGEVTLPEGRVQVVAGSVFIRGTRFMNVDLAALLEEQFARQGQSGR